MILYTCPKCRQEITDEHDHSACEFSLIAPMLNGCKQSWVAVAGDSNQGKTTYIESLLLVLKKMQTRLPGFAVNGLDTHSKMLLQRRLQTESSTSPATSYMPEPVLLDLFGIPVGPTGITERRNFFVFDTPGEYLKTGGGIEIPEMASVFSQVQVPWLLYELSEDGKHGDRSPLGELVSNLLLRYRENQMSLDGKSLLIVYTMVQRLLDEFPSDLQEYLYSDRYFGSDELHTPNMSGFSFANYMKEAARVSETLEAMTANYSHGGALLLQLAKQHNLKLHFCMTESIGHDVGDGKFHDMRSPKRVLDPLFWTVFLEQDQFRPLALKRQILVCIDPDLPEDSEWYRGGYLNRIWNTLGKQFDIDFYFLGRDQPDVSSPASPPKSPPKKPCSKLIGPLLKNVSDPSAILVIADTPPIDLADYQFGPLQNRMLMLVCKEESRDFWTPTIFLRSSDDIDVLKRKINF